MRSTRLRTENGGCIYPLRALQERPAKVYVQAMIQPAPVAESVENEAERQARLAWEAEGVAKARAELDAGCYVDADEIDAWIDSIGADHELPPPPTRRR